MIPSKIIFLVLLTSFVSVQFNLFHFIFLLQANKMFHNFNIYTEYEMKKVKLADNVVI